VWPVVHVFLAGSVSERETPKAHVVRSGHQHCDCGLRRYSTAANCFHSVVLKCIGVVKLVCIVGSCV